MSPTDAIAMLDDAIARDGETVTFMRGATSVNVQAFVRGIKADEIIGTISQSDLHVIISPTGMTGFGVPLASDKIVVKGKQRQVKFPDPAFIADIWVRCNLIAAG